MIAIINGKVVTVTGQTFEKGTVLIEDGKIKAVGADVAVPQGAEVIDASDCWVTPGLIDCHTHISNFNEPNSNPSIPLDGNEMSDPVTPQVRAMDAEQSPAASLLRRKCKPSFSTSEQALPTSSSNAALDCSGVVICTISTLLN